MQTFRPEVKAFCDAAETLSSPILLGRSLTEDERAVIRMYIDTLEKKVLGIPAEQTPADK